MEEVIKRFHNVASALGDDVDGHIRVVRERGEEVSWRQRVLQPVSRTDDFGAMVTLFSGGGVGYAATSDLSEDGLARACRRAQHMAHQVAASMVPGMVALPAPAGDQVQTYASDVRRPVEQQSLRERIDWLKGLDDALHGGDARVVDDFASLWMLDVESVIAYTSGQELHQHSSLLSPELRVVVHDEGETAKRSTGLRGISRQGGLELLDAMNLHQLAEQFRDEAVQLLTAPQCPTGKMDIVLMPDQMMLQIHESIGHPIELDRILGDERNYAGTSFVTPDMFGSYMYGSELLNVSFDPDVTEEFATYGFDDEGTRAERTLLIEKGLLKRPLGGRTSQGRAGMDGVACTRASSWNRPPTDRMANLNVEPGTSTLDDIIADIDDGVLMHTNTSWSIDDSRNKFQFGCEMGQRIENGKLTHLVKKPNYRGISATFWRNLKAVGDASTREVLGTPWCGKAEPNQIIRVGHASPVCAFADVDVFGGAA